MVIVNAKKKGRHSHIQTLRVLLSRSEAWICRLLNLNGFNHDRNRRRLLWAVLLVISMLLFIHLGLQLPPRKNLPRRRERTFKKNHSILMNETNYSIRHVTLGGTKGYEYVQVKRISSEVSDNVNGGDADAFVLNAMPESESEYSVDLKETRRADRAHEVFETKDCKAMTEWQTMSYPTCNIIHELFSSNNLAFLDKGGFRSVWRVLDRPELVLKTLVWTKDFSYREYDRHRRDANAYSQLSFSKHIPDIYSYCTNSAVFDFSPDGNLEGKLLELERKKIKWPRSQKLRVAWQVAKALADVHSVGSTRGAKFNTALTHTDVTSDQFLYLDGMFKLNDFNRARFIRWNEEEEKPCTFEIPKSPGKFRSPEEYEYIGLTEKVDIFQMSNIFFYIWTGVESWDDYSRKAAPKHVRKGKLPPLPKKLQHSTHPIDKAFKRILKMTQVFDPKKRATAQQVELFLRKKLDSFNITFY